MALDGPGEEGLRHGGSPSPREAGREGGGRNMSAALQRLSGSMLPACTHAGGAQASGQGACPLEEEMQRHRKRGVTLGPEMAQQVKHKVCQGQNQGTPH